MRKVFLEKELEAWGEIKTNSLTATEDLEVVRLMQTMNEHITKFNKEKAAIGDKAAKNGVVFGEDGKPDTEKSNAKALDKANEQFTILINENVDLRVFNYDTLHKIKTDNLDKFGNAMSFTYLVKEYMIETKEEQKETKDETKETN